MSGQFSIDEFSGTARIFPLPNLVMFPHVAQPLHIFESRYVEMLEDALATDQLMATALLRPGWEGEYDGRPEINPVICLGRVISQVRTDEGKYNILLAGVSRAEIVQELPAQRSFRQAEVELLIDDESQGGSLQLGDLHRELVECFRRFIPESEMVQQQLDEILGDQANLGPLSDLIAYSLPLDLEFKQQLLGETSVLLRSELLLDQLTATADQMDEDSRIFPPEFSDN